MSDDSDLDRQKSQLLLLTLRAVAMATGGPDPYMVGHSGRVAEYCDRLAQAMGLSDEERFLLSLAAWFHDIGNLSTPAYILRKPSALAEDEMEEMRVHPVKGSELFAGHPELAEIARSIRHHHERVDGTGYPDGLRGDAIPLFSRIILVADTYEAMTHNRSYRRAMPHAEALRRIQEGAGIQFDPTIVEHLVVVMKAGPDA